MTRVRASAKPARPSEVARAEMRLARIAHRDFDLAEAITAAEEAQRRLAQITRLHGWFKGRRG